MRFRLGFQHASRFGIALGAALVLLQSSGLGFGQNAAESPHASVAQQAHAPSSAPPPNDASHLIGATVLSKDHRLVGAVDDVITTNDGHALVVGLAGYLGLGEKDVIVPSAKIRSSVRVELTSAQTYADDKYGGSTPRRLVVDKTEQELAAAQPFVARSGDQGVGKPSAGSGTPLQTGHPKKQVPPTTQSGGPG